MHFGADGTAALTTSGEVVWKTRLSYQSQHGAGGSPIVYGDLLIVSCDGHDAAYVVALDKRTGKARWKTNRRQPADQAYTTPLVIRVGDRDQVVSVGAYRAAAYDPMTGREIWRVSYGDGFSNVPRPVYGHGLVYIATGFQEPSLMAVRVDGTGDVTKTHVAWTLRRGAPLTPSPLLVGEELYVVTDGGIASCLDAMTGAIHWQMRLGDTFSASPVFVDGRIYFLGENGGAMAIAPGKQFRRVGNSRLDGALLASMAVSRGIVFHSNGQSLVSHRGTSTRHGAGVAAFIAGRISMNERFVSRSIVLSLMVSLVAVSAFAQATQPAKPFEPTVGQAGKDVVWVPTPQVLVEKMLDMAKVTPQDFVMDLGSGDGRTVITAAKRGARALGIEYNPDMVELSRSNAAAAKVTRQGDVRESRPVRDRLLEGAGHHDVPAALDQHEAAADDPGPASRARAS